MNCEASWLSSVFTPCKSEHTIRILILASMMGEGRSREGADRGGRVDRERKEEMDRQGERLERGREWRREVEREVERYRDI